MPEFAASWGWIPTILAVGGVLFSMVRKGVHIEEQTAENKADIVDLKVIAGEFKDFRTEFTTWRTAHEREEHQRSKRMDAITLSVSEINKSMNRHFEKSCKAHAERLSRIEGRLNGS